MITLIASLFLCILCAKLILDVREKLNATSYVDIGTKLFGAKGKAIVSFCLAFSQVGFTCAYVYFNIFNFHDIFQKILKVTINKWVFAAFFYLLWTGMCWVRKIQIFAHTHVFADCMIVFTMAVVMGYAIQKMSEDGQALTDAEFIDDKNWQTAIGFAVYAYEGIGIVFPVQDVCRDKEKYPMIVYGVITACAIIFVFFGMFCVFAWGPLLTTPLITDVLPDNNFIYIVKFLFCLNLIFSYPLQLYPAHIVIENYLYINWEKSKKRQWFKNFTRSMLVLYTILFTMWLDKKISNFLAILGALTCTPIAFTFPGLFHYKVCAVTKTEKAIDIAVIIFSFACTVYCTLTGILNWNS